MHISHPTIAEKVTRGINALFVSVHILMILIANTPRGKMRDLKP